VLGLAAKPGSRVPVAVNDADHADRSLVDLEVHSIRKSSEQRPAQSPRDNGEGLRPLADDGKCFVKRQQKAKSRRWRLPFERILDLIPRRFPKAQDAHLARPFGQSIA
jgi:hypothetical protein